MKKNAHTKTSRAGKKSASISMMLKSPFNLVMLLVIGWFVFSFLVIPAFEVLKAVFWSRGELSLRSFERLKESALAMRSLFNSVLLAVILAVTVNIVGVFVVLVTRYFDIKGARILWLGYASSLIYGGIVMVSGYKFVYGPQGIVTRFLQNFIDLDPNWFSGAFAVAFVLTLGSTGNHILFLSNAINKVDYQTVEASRMMGASSWTTLRKVVLPTLKPMIFAITILSFLGGLVALDAPLILGKRDFQTASPMILTFANTAGSRDLAATLSIVLGVMTLLLIMGLNRLERKGQYFSVSKVSTSLVKQEIENPVANAAVHIVAYLLLVIYLAPPLLITVFSFTNVQAIQRGSIRSGDFTLDNYIKALTLPGGYSPLVISLIYGVVQALAVVILMLVAARLVVKYRNPITATLEYLLHIPWVLPSVLIALGLIIGYSKPNILAGNIVLMGTTLLLLVAYIGHSMPFTFRLLKAAFLGLPSNLEEAASLLGASQFVIFRKILLPLVLPTAAAIAALEFKNVLSEYNIAAFLSSPVAQPLGVVIKNVTTSESLSDSTALVFVYAVLLMIINTFVLWLVYGRRSKS